MAAQIYRNVKIIGSFGEATSFSISPAGFIYTSDRTTNMVYKMDTLGNVIVSTGGYGWQQGSFDEPVDVFSNALSVFVSDKNNHRIQQFDKDLNYVSQLYKRESKNLDVRFGYPLGCAVSNLGDFYVLDSENKRVIKFDLQGNFLLNFGGFNDAKFALSNPRKIGVAPDNRIYVLNGNSIFAYDNFGNGIKKMELGSLYSSFSISGNNIILFYGKDFILGDLINGSTKKLNVAFPEDFVFENIVSFSLYNSMLYILTKSEIQVYSTAE
jgi:hypothetical protein